MNCIKRVQALVGIFTKISNQLIKAIDKCKGEVAKREESITTLKNEQYAINQAIGQAEKLQGNICKLLS